jgi:hypothetical protein
MLRFFRQIRQRLLTDNKFSKYLLYAVGEILLVVIGILIALQIDNWNEERKMRAVEIRTLLEIQANLEDNIRILERTVVTESEYLSYNKLILDNLNNRKPYSEELDRAFAVYFWTITTNPVVGSYEFLKLKGFDLITDDSLRNSIRFIFENEFPILKNENEVWSNNLQQNISYPFHVKHFERYYSMGSDGSELELARPFDYDELLQNREFKSINTEIISNRKWNIRGLKKLIQDIELLIQDIEVFLNNKGASV